MLTTEYMSGIENAYNAFKNSEDIEKGILASTRAAFGGSAYSVELLPDATYRVLWKNNIGNVYNSPGVILDIPILTDDELDDGEENDNWFYDNAKEEMDLKYEQWKQDVQDYAKTL